LRCVEACAVAALLLVAPSDGAVPKEVHEASLEAGLRVVVAPGAGSEVAAALSIPVGYANDAETVASGWASFMAGYATFELPRWSIAVGPDATLFRATLPADQVEAGLSELAKRLVGDGVEEELLKRFVEQRKVSPPDAADRLRETAWPQSRAGGRSADVNLPPKEVRTKEALKKFLAERVGSEGSVVALVGPGTPAALELAATHAFATLPRAKGVVPKEDLEAMPAAARKVAAPAGATGGFVGLRLPWHRDERGDGAALAIAWLEATLERDVTLRVDATQGTLIGFSVDATEFATFAAKLDAAVAQAGKGLDDPARARAVDHLAQKAEAIAQRPAEVAAQLAADAAAYADPLASFARAERLKTQHGTGGPDDGFRAEGWLLPAGRLDAVPAAKRPDGT
jgi:hypothetical protein